MCDLGVGDEQHLAAARADRGAEVDVLRVHEIAFVEQADRLRVGPADQQAGAAHPVDLARPGASAAPHSGARSASPGRCRGRAVSDAARQTAPIIEPNDSSARPRLVDQSWADHRGCRVSTRGPARGGRSRRDEALCLGSAGAPAPRTTAGSRYCSRGRSRRSRRRRSRVTPGQRCRTACGGAVGRGVVHDERLVVDRAGSFERPTRGTRRCAPSSCR